MKPINRIYIAAALLFVLPLAVFGAMSVFDTDATESELENRALKQKPEFSFEALFAGSYTRDFEEYYSDTFPLRELFMSLNRTVSQFYYYSPGNAGEDDVTLVIPHSGDGVASGGEGLATPPPTPTVPAPSRAPGATPTPAPPPTPEPSPTPEPLPELDTPDDADFHKGSIIFVGNRAMEISYANPDVMSEYAAVVNRYAEQMPDAKVINLITPNGGEFYSPEAFHTGSYSQKDMIDATYAMLDQGVVAVDAYGELRRHVDEYLYFRTDHHWTQLGAYYAYVAFCEANELDPVPLDGFEEGSMGEFVGSMYGFTSQYPQSRVLRENPDTLTYYRPAREFSARVYPNAKMNEAEGWDSAVIASKTTAANKYLTFISGDNPVMKITSDVANGRSIVVVKESYGNAFVPFLVNHYETVYVVDARKFSGEGTPNMNLPSFVAEHAIDEVLVIDYPLVISNKAYVNILANLLR